MVWFGSGSGFFQLNLNLDYQVWSRGLANLNPKHLEPGLIGFPASSTDGTRPIARLMGKPLGWLSIICFLTGSLWPRAELALLQITYPTQQLFCRRVMSADGSLFVRLKAVNNCTDHLLPLISLNSSVSCTVVEVQTVGVAIAS